MFRLLGSKTPEVMKERLRSAIRKGDKDELESALDEAVAAGMPELDADIYRARKSLDDQDTGSRRSSRRGQQFIPIFINACRSICTLTGKIYVCLYVYILGEITKFKFVDYTFFHNDNKFAILEVVDRYINLFSSKI